MAAVYEQVRSEPDPQIAHQRWRRDRDRLFGVHPQSPLEESDPLRSTGLPYWPYDSSLRWTLPVRPVENPVELQVDTGADGTTTLHQAGVIVLPAPFDAQLAVWWLHQYGGGIFLPVRDDTAGLTSYGGGRYLLDTAKGADLGGTVDSLVVDLNFLYHPSCRYSSRWVCPLAPEANTVKSPIEAGERLVPL